MGNEFKEILEATRELVDFLGKDNVEVSISIEVEDDKKLTKTINLDDELAKLT